MTSNHLRSLQPPPQHPMREPVVRKGDRSRGAVIRFQLEPYLHRAGCATLRELARLVGVNDKHLSRVINGRAYLTEGLQARLTSHLQLTPDEVNHAFGLPGWKPSTIRSEQRGAAEGAVSGGVSPPRPIEPGHLRLVSRQPAAETPSP